MASIVKAGHKAVLKAEELWRGLLLTSMITGAASFVASTYGGSRHDRAGGDEDDA